ncbi:GMC oxidoreductase [Synechococcus sp. UW140]|uniref:GMC oxidoreductase n=1 Tax=Synechococcus sp. UW140 TaxID=368503 RepID=UPI002600733F|nr:GMC oxidoreductase [Synechococcus sp. UW140]
MHDLGGVPMGNNTERSVLYGWKSFHTCSNLLVTDSSCRPSSGWQCPTLSSMALIRQICLAAISRQ